MAAASERTVLFSAYGAERIDARDVLDANAKTALGFSARILGRFVRSGPDAWDDYVLQPVAGDAEESIEVMAEVPVQVESHGARFRMRRHGEVLRLEWRPAEAEHPANADRRALFMAECMRPWEEDPGIGAAAVIAEKLSAKPPKPSLD